jgi:hypothetical protein
MPVRVEKPWRSSFSTVRCRAPRRACSSATDFTARAIQASISLTVTVAQRFLFNRGGTTFVA